MSGAGNEPTLRFLGGAGTVTGSKFLLEASGARILIDCGLYQGAKELRLRNWAPFPVPAESIDAVVLTHAHLDHSGYLPLLVRRGFRGNVVCTAPTRALCEIVLPDSARLQEEEARHANKAGYSKHKPALPLYTERDARDALHRFRGVPFDRTEDVARGVAATFRRAGHILGAATVSLEVAGATLQFSGDLGRNVHPILRPPEPPARADAIVVESTYGNREHDDEDTLELLAQAVSRTANRGGSVVIPAFAVDRTEVVLFHLRALMQAGRIPRLTVYIDSPMALAALHVYREAFVRRDPEIRTDLDVDVLDTGTLVETRTVEESKEINHVRAPSIIISASGMATGGRVLYHLARRLPDARNTVILPGYMVPGTRGRALMEGATSLKMHGRYVPVHAEIVHLPGLSAHADADEIVEWLGRCPSEPDATYVVHGETQASAAIVALIEGRLGWHAVAPGPSDQARIAPGD